MNVTKELLHTYYELPETQQTNVLTIYSLSLARHKLIPISGWKHALDLGAGNLRDTELLARHFEEVDALDREPYMLERMHRLDEEAVHCIVCDMTSHCYPPYRYDYINAQWVLPFIPPEQFDEVFKHIAESLKPWGLLSGQFFGSHDYRIEADEDEALSHIPGMGRLMTLLVSAGLNPVQAEEHEFMHPSVYTGEEENHHYFDIIAQQCSSPYSFSIEWPPN
ncbi:MAG: class I SAM-dependent methyltransferase [Candidatus Roizmanbacteria bacterium]|nr:class I SAM-dependent methyltransferase [Candidatus Roizmanbacteria bacterium]